MLESSGKRECQLKNTGLEASLSDIFLMVGVEGPNSLVVPPLADGPDCIKQQAE